MMRRLRNPNTPSLLHRLLRKATQPLQLLRATVFDVPPLVQLALLQLIFLVGSQLSSWIALLRMAVASGSIGAVILFTLDKRLLAYDCVFSDEIVATTVILVGLISVISFVTTTLAIQSVLDGVKLLVSGVSHAQTPSLLPLRICPHHIQMHA